MTTLTYRAILFPPLGQYAVSCSDGRTFRIKPSLAPIFTNNRVTFSEGSEDLFKAEYHDGWWRITGGKNAPGISLERMKGIIPKWRLWYDGKGIEEELVAQELGIQFTNAVFPNSHIVKFTLDNLFFVALAYGNLRYSSPE